MPTIEQSAESKIDMRNYTPIESTDRPPIPAPYSTPQSTQRSPYLRCPVPSISSTATPDDLRQFYRDSSVPQYRAAF